MGAVADKIGKKPVLLLFALVFGAGCLTAGVSQSIIVYTVGICMMGAGCSVCESLATATAADADPVNAARFSNLIQCFLSAGAIGGPLVMKLLMEHNVFDWRGVFYICAGAFFVLAAVLALCTFPKGEQAVIRESSSRKGILTSGVFLCLFVGMVLYVGLENGFGYFVETLFQQQLDSQTLGAYGISAYWAGMTAARLVYSMWMYHQERVLQLSFVGAAVAFVLLLLAPNGAWGIVCCALVGVAYGPIWSTLVACATKRFPDRKGTVAGLMSTGCGIGGIVFPLLTGVIAQNFRVSGAFLMLAMAALLGAALCLHVGRKQ